MKASNRRGAIGAAGTVLHLGGDGAWAIVDSGTSSQLEGIWGSAAVSYVVAAIIGFTFAREPRPIGAAEPAAN